MISQSDLHNWVDEHEIWRRQCMNLIASENASSPAVRQYWNSDLVQRYGNYLGRDLANRRYTGNRFIQRIEVALKELVQEIFCASEVELRAVSGHVAGLAVIMATCRPGDTVLEVAGDCGGHGLAQKAAESSLIDLQVLPIPFDSQSYNIDLPQLNEVLHEKQPRLVILGTSNFLFPSPVQEIAALCARYPQTILAYDASHVLGLIACGAFQQPLQEGAQIVFGSTHKTLPGPQGGLIFSNNRELMDLVSKAVYPGIVTNHHLMRSPSLAAALLEMHHHPEYAQVVIENARTLGLSLQRHGVPVVAAAQGVTGSHTVLVQTYPYGKGRVIAALLEDADILSSYARLTADLGVEAIRLGSQEVTRLGAKQDHMEHAAEVIAAVLQNKLSPHDALPEVHAWAQGLPGMSFCDNGG